MGTLLHRCVEVRKAIELLFGMVSGVGPGIHVLYGSPRASRGRVCFWHGLWHFLASCDEKGDVILYTEQRCALLKLHPELIDRYTDMRETTIDVCLMGLRVQKACCQNSYMS